MLKYLLNRVTWSAAYQVEKTLRDEYKKKKMEKKWEKQAEMFKDAKKVDKF